MLETPSRAPLILLLFLHSVMWGFCNPSSRETLLRPDGRLSRSTAWWEVWFHCNFTKTSPCKTQSDLGPEKHSGVSVHPVCVNKRQTTHGSVAALKCLTCQKKKSFTAIFLLTMSTKIPVVSKWSLERDTWVNNKINAGSRPTGKQMLRLRPGNVQ